MGNIVGNNPRKWASNQVKIREQYLGLENKTPEALVWSTNNTAWIRAISSTAITTEKSKELTGVQYYAGGALAKEFMLFAGTSAIYENNDEKGDITGYGAVLKSGVLNTSWDKLDNNRLNNSAYGFSSSAERGLVPMPGIQSLNITTLNRGSLRNASLKIKAYSREQFAVLDALFMRPGYSLLIEWGHTIYFTGPPNSPKYKNARFNTKAFQEINQFLDGTNSAEDGSTNILKAITAERGNGSFKDEDSGNTLEGTQGNYDGFYGKVTNFVWGINSDGSYDIEVKAISTGDIVESLTINSVAKPNTTVTPKKEGTPSKTSTKFLINITTSSNQTYQRGVTSGTEKQYKEYWISDGRSESGEEYETAKLQYGTKPSFTTLTLKPPSDVIVPEKELEDQTLITSKDKTVFNEWLYEKYSYLKNNISKKGKKSLTSSASTTLYIQTLNTYGDDESLSNEGLLMVQPFTTLDVKSGIDGSVVNQVTKLAQNAPYQYARLETVLRFIEDNLLMQIANEDKSRPQPCVTFDLENENYMYTQPGQLSADPNVCVIPFIFPKGVDKGSTNKNVFPNLIQKNSVIIYWEDVFKGVRFNIEGSAYVANLLEIPVNIHYIAQTLSKSTTNNAIQLLPFLESLMYGIQEALGSLNKFSVTYDHDSNQIIIRDDVPLDPKVATQTSVIPDDRTFFNVTGYKKIDPRTDNPKKPSSSFITNVGISTTLSKAFATMVTIGAQASSQSDVSNSTSLNKFNIGLKDSVSPSKISKAVINKENDPLTLFKDTIISLNNSNSLLTYFYKNAKSPSGDLISSTRSQISAFNRYVSTLNLYQQGGNQIPSSQGFIPFSMNLDMMGFSGLRIYEKFYISTEILPYSYPDTMSFVVKGLSHSVDSSGWKTKIDSLTITNVDNLPKSPEDIPSPDYEVEPDPETSFTDATADGDELPLLLAFLREREGFSPVSYWDVNYYRIGYGTGTITRSDGTFIPVSQNWSGEYKKRSNGTFSLRKGEKVRLGGGPNNRVTREEAELDLQRRIKTEFRPKVIKRLRESGVNYEELPLLVKLVFVDISYNYGSAFPRDFINGWKGGGVDGLINVLKRRSNIEGNSRERRLAEIKVLQGTYPFQL
jgi:hypothetical protein